MSSNGWTIYARNPAGQREGVVEDYIEAELMPVYCDVGTWSLKLNGRAAFAAQLAQPDWGIIAVREDGTAPPFSGPMKRAHVTQTLDSYQIELTGITDEDVLKRRLVSPSPAQSAPPYDAQASDDQTDVASTVIRHYVDVNCGPGAVLPRQISGLTVASDPLIGASVTGKGRWDTNVLAFIQPLAVTGQVGFRVAQVGDGREFQTFIPVDRTGSVQFSFGLGNLAEFDYERTAPETTYAYIGASGTGTARIVQEFPDSDALTQWGRIEGPLVDQRGTSDPVQLQQTATDTFAQSGEQASLSITPIETDSLRYGQHYNLGDKITVQLDQSTSTPYAESGQIQDIIRTVKIKLSVDDSSITPAIGTAARSDVSRIFRRLLKVDGRLNNLERQ